MKRNPLAGLRKLGQSICLDNLSRKLMDSGELKRLIDEDGVTGITSNPTIFQKAISGSTAYDASIQKLLAKGVKDEKELFLGLAFEDIARAADMLLPAYQASNGSDGFVSIEVSPDLAYDTRATVAEAKRMFATLGKKNVLVKVPATSQGVPAIEELTSLGVNVNVTLLFAVKRYEEVVEAYIRGLEKRVQSNQPIHEIASIASFFVSRVDTLADKLLEARLAAAPSKAEKEKITALMGKAAVANAKIAYRRYREMFSTPRFLGLKQKGARVQRLLWGSSGTKNPAYSDIKYVQELIGADTVNTLPEATMAAFKDHGDPRVTIQDHLEEAERLPGQLESAGVRLTDVTEQLEKEGVKLFADSFFLLLKDLAVKRDSLLSKK
jgi:transaldolase/glucose-6-phosphate isomerase